MIYVKQKILFVALGGQNKAVLRAPPRPSVSSADKKGVLPDPSWPFADKIKLFSAPLPAALRVALRGQKKAVLRAPPRPSVSSVDKKRCSHRPYPPFADKAHIALTISVHTNSNDS